MYLGTMVGREGKGREGERFYGVTYLHVAWFDEPRLVSQHLVDGEQVEDLGRNILQPLQPLRVTIVLKKLSFKNCYLRFTNVCTIMYVRLCIASLAR